MTMVKFSISIDEAVYTALKEEAECVDRSVSATVNAILSNALGLGFPEGENEPVLPWRSAIEARIAALENSMTSGMTWSMTKKTIPEPGHTEGMTDGMTGMTSGMTSGMTDLISIPDLVLIMTDNRVTTADGKEYEKYAKRIRDLAKKHHIESEKHGRQAYFPKADIMDIINENFETLAK